MLINLFKQNKGCNLAEIIVYIGNQFDDEKRVLGDVPYPSLVAFCADGFFCGVGELKNVYEDEEGRLVYEVWERWAKIPNLLYRSEIVRHIA